MTGKRLIQGDYSARRYLHSDEVFCKETNWNIDLPNEREFKNGKCIVTDKDDTAYSIDELVSLLNEFQKENFQFKQQISEQAIQLDYLKNENQHMKDVLDENKQLKEFINKIADDKGEIVLFNGYGYNIRKVLHNE